VKLRRRHSFALGGKLGTWNTSGCVMPALRAGRWYTTGIKDWLWHRWRDQWQVRQQQALREAARHNSV
jgi:hypothetical protein